MRSKIFRFIALIVASVLIALRGFAASPPTLVNYQGVLRSNTDAPLSGSFDMTFRFFSAAVGGDEVLIDRHTAAVGAPVTVSGGLFNVMLGAGSMSDGAGPGIYTSLVELFRDYSGVYLSIQVGTETLSPRTQLLASAYALNATNLGGKSSSSFLDTSSTTQTKAGTAVFDASAVGTGYGVRALGVDGGLYAGDATGSGHCEVGKDDYGLRAFGTYPGGMAGSFKDTNYTGEAWLAAGDSGVFGYGTYSAGIFRHGTPTSFDAEVSLGTPTYGVRSRGTNFGGYFESNALTSSAYLGLDGGGAYIQGNNYGGFFKESSGASSAYLGRVVDNGLYLEHRGADIYGQDYGLVVSADGLGIYARSATLWAGEFDSNSVDGHSFVKLAYGKTGVLARGTYGGCDFCSAPLLAMDYTYSGQAALANGDVGVLGHGTYQGGIFRHTAGGSYDTYANLAGGGGSGISSNGTKNFVQNHPYEKDKVIEYASLEGDEVGVYTRGSARLVDGRAEISLSGSFQWVTNPDIGLTAQVTPRGAAIPLAVESVSTTRLVVIGPPGADVDFDYSVNGLRIGFEAVSIVADKWVESPIPSLESHREQLAKSPELAAYSPLTRFTAMDGSLRRLRDRSMSQSAALKEAIGYHAAGIEPPMTERTLTPEHQADFEERVARGEIKPSLPGDPSYEKTHGPPSRPVLAERSSPSITPANPAPIRLQPQVTSVTADAEPTWPAFAVPVEIDEAVETGDLLSNQPARPGRLVRANQPNEAAVMGVVAGAANQRWTERAPLALAGTIVLCKVDASYGPIAANDLLVASPTPGFAMHAPAGILPGTIVAKALESRESGTGTIRVLVMSR